MSERYNPALANLVEGLLGEYRKLAFVSADQIVQPQQGGQPGDPSQQGQAPAGAPPGADPGAAAGAMPPPPSAAPSPATADPSQPPQPAIPQEQSLNASQVRALMREELNSHADTSKTKKKLSPDERMTQIESTLVKILEHLGHVNPPPPVDQKTEQQALAATNQPDPSMQGQAATPIGAATMEPATAAGAAAATASMPKAASLSGPAALAAMVGKLRSI
jgi:hypothetical protein